MHIHTITNTHIDTCTQTDTQASTYWNSHKHWCCIHADIVVDVKGDCNGALPLKLKQYSLQLQVLPINKKTDDIWRWTVIKGWSNKPFHILGPKHYEMGWRFQSHHFSFSKISLVAILQWVNPKTMLVGNNFYWKLKITPAENVNPLRIDNYWRCTILPSISLQWLTNCSIKLGSFE